MKKILETFKNLYKGENIVKTHLILAALYLPIALFSATAQFLDKEFKEFLVPILIAVLVFGLLSIVPMLFLAGFYYRFLNKRMTEPHGLPKWNLDCLITGLKAIPVGFVWCLYIAVPVILLIGSFVGVLALLLSGTPSAVEIIGAILLVLLFIALFMALVVVISPFVAQVYFKYSENFEYSAEIFNPLTIFCYMKKSFKESIIVALKYIVVNIAVSSVVQLVLGVIMVILLMFGMVFLIAASPANPDPTKSIGFIMTILIFSGIFGSISGYSTFVVSLAYADNLLEVYKDKIAQNEQ